MVSEDVLTSLFQNYYQCIDGNAFLLSCPLNQYFDEARQTCDISDNVDCVVTPQPSPTPPTISCEGVPNFRFIPSPIYCNVTYFFLKINQLNSYFSLSNILSSVFFCRTISNALMTHHSDFHAPVAFTSTIAFKLVIIQQTSTANLRVIKQHHNLHQKLNVKMLKISQTGRTPLHAIYSTNVSSQPRSWYHVESEVILT